MNQIIAEPKILILPVSGSIRRFSSGSNISRHIIALPIYGCVVVCNCLIIVISAIAKNVDSHKNILSFT